MKQPWMDKLLPGSWRCVPFYVEEGSLSGGRRLAVHEFPARDEAEVEDLGRKARRHQISFFGLGRDYFYWRDEMRAALEEPGPGTLCHPYLGELRALVEDYSLTETPAQGGIFRVQATFVEATGELRAVTEIDYSGRVTSTSAALLTAASAELGQMVKSAAITPAALLSAALRSLAEAEAVLEADFEAISEALDLAGAAAAIADMVAFPAAVIGAMRAIATAGASTPGRSSGNRISVLSADGLTLGRDWPDPQVGMPAVPSPWSPVAATSRQIAAAQQQRAVLLFARAAMLGALAEATVATTFADADSALAAAAQLDTLVDAIVGDTLVGPALFATACTLRVALDRYLRTIVAKLPRRAQFTPSTTLPAIVIAQRLYGDARRASELVELNHLANPLFCPGGEPLEVLSDD